MDSPFVKKPAGSRHINRAEAAKKLHVRKAVLIVALASFPKGGGENEGASERSGAT